MVVGHFEAGDGSRRELTNREYAMAYCAAGFAVYPLIPGSKSPAIGSPHPPGSAKQGRCRGECGWVGHGFYDARVDAKWADRYWTAYPDHGIAARPGSDQIVLDVDPRHGGDVALAELEAVHGRLPEAFTVLSGRGDGGEHRWFSGVAEPVCGKLCCGVDVISHSRGGVVMPPSLHSATGLPYQFKTPMVDVARALSWLQEMCRSMPKPTRTYLRPVGRLSPSQVRRRGRGLIAAVANACEGERHTTLYWAAMRAADDGILDGHGGLQAALVEAACDAGLPVDEIDSIITDVVGTTGDW